MKELPLSNGEFTLVDDEDFYRLARYRWRRIRTNGYVGRAKGNSAKKTQKWIILAREIMQPPPGMIVDHKDGNILNNQRSNLRICTYQQNRHNTRGKNKTGFIGIRRMKSGRFNPAILDGKKKRYLGVYDTAEEAARVYDREALRLHGEFAVLNFPIQADSSNNTEAA